MVQKTHEDAREAQNGQHDDAAGIQRRGTFEEANGGPTEAQHGRHEEDAFDALADALRGISDDEVAGQILPLLGARGWQW